MQTIALGKRGLGSLAAILILAATTTIADARMGTPGMGGMGGMTTPQMNTGMYRDRHNPFPEPPAAVRPTWTPPAIQGGGGTGGFSPGGGSGSTGKKKPNLQ